jgi:hypothetical protein
LRYVRQLDTLKSSLPLWRQIIWPDRKADWVANAFGAAVGTFTTIVNVSLRLGHSGSLLLFFGFGMAAVVATCYGRVSRAVGHLSDDGIKESALDNAVKCWPCSVFRFCLFSILALILLNKTEPGKQAMEATAERLGSMNIKLDDIAGGVAKIDSKLNGVKQETSADPRKELANRGALWTVDAFFEALRGGNDVNVKLFLAGGMTTDLPDSQGRPLPVILALNTHNVADMLDLLVDAGLDVNHSYDVAGAFGSQRMTLLSRAIEKSSSPLVEALIKHHVDVNSPMQTFGAMGLTRDTYPLASAIYWKRWEIAQLLLDAGANPAAGDYAAYREARALRERTNGDVQSDQRLDEHIRRLKPQGSAAAHVESELRLQDIEQKLNQIALASLRTPPGSTERRRLDAEYDELQVERTKLRADLHVAGK